MTKPNFQLELRKILIPEFVFGVGALNLVGNYARNLGAKKVLLVTDSGVTEVGWAGKVEESLRKSEIEYHIFSGVNPNPSDGEVEKGVAIYSEEKCDVIVAVGGGSPIDCAKGIGILVSNGGRIQDYEGVDLVGEPLPPLICIPTTAGTSADVSQFAIIRDLERKIKFAIISKAVVPDAALIDPVTTTTMDSYLTACTGMDALTHAIEAYVSNAASPMTDLHALEAIKLITMYLNDAIKDPDDIQLRTALMLGSLDAGIAFSNASLGMVHAMAHSLGGYLNLSHGECNAVLLEYAIMFNYKSASEKFDNIGEAMGLRLENLSDDVKMNRIIGEIQHLRTGAGINLNLSEMGVKRGDLKKLAEFALSDPCMATNPRYPDLEEIEEIYERAL